MVILVVGCSALVSSSLDSGSNSGSDSQASGKSNVAVNKAIKRLEAAGVISKTSVGAKRNRVWECSELLGLLDALDRELALAPISTASALRAK